MSEGDKLKVCIIVCKQGRRDPRIIRYARSLEAGGCMVDILGFADPDNHKSKQENGNISYYDIPITRISDNLVQYFVLQTLSLILFSFRLLPLYFSKRYDVIHANNIPDFLVFAAVIPKLFGAKVILDIHDPIPELFLLKKKSSNPLSKIMYHLMVFTEKISTSFSDAVITVNSTVKGNLVKRGIPAEKVSVVRNLPDLTLFDHKQYAAKVASANGQFRLIFPGTIKPQYGLETAIAAIPLIREKIPQIQLEIIGPQREHSQDLVNLVESLGIESSVVFTPLIPQAEVAQHLSKANIGIYPAVKNHYMDLATPTKVLEYAAMKLPILTSRLDAVEDVFDDQSVMFVEAENREAFARGVIDLYEHPEHAREMVERAYLTIIERFQWEQDSAVYMQLLENLVK